MKPARSSFLVLLYGLVIGVCVVVSGIEVGGVLRRVAAQQERRRQERPPAFGQADLVYFSEPTCPACRAAAPTIEALRRRYPSYRIARVDTTTPDGIALQEEYNRAYRVPAALQDRIPSAFAGSRFFVGADQIARNLPLLLAAGPLERPHPQVRLRARGQAILSERFRSMGVAPVLVAGLVDSINPCAIATLIFFLSYMTLGGRRPRDLLWIGGLFTLGTFLTYFLIGLGLLRALRSLQAVPALARWLYPVAAVVTLVLAVISFLDYRRAGRGETGQIALQMPRALKLKVHAAIRTRLGLRQLAPAAFFTAVVVSALEFTCTSQVYLPTLMYMAQAGEQRLKAFALLILYNLMFVLPLILLSTAAYFGASARALAQLAARHTATAKLAMSLLFIGFSLYLFSVSLR
jgi:cytochrome c biogenesis protein CcdA